MNQRQKKEMKLELLREKSRRNFFLFFKNTIPSYIHSDFYLFFAQSMISFAKRGDKKEFPSMLCNMPPRTGKTSLMIRYAIWRMLQNKDFPVIYATYGDRLSKSLSRQAKMVMESDWVKNLWPDIHIQHGNTALDHWGLTNGSSVLWTSVGGSLSGFPYALGLCDDLYKDMNSAYSDAYNESLNEWFKSAFLTRRLPERNETIILFTRWSQDDIAGAIIKEEQRNPLFPKFDKIIYPIIAQEDDEFRKKGEILAKERFSIEYIEGLRAQLGTKIFDALYLCNPVSSTDRILRTEWIEQVDKLPICNWNNQQVIVAIDMAFKGKTTSDYNVCICLARGLDNRIYLLDYLRIQADFTDFLAKFSSWYSGLPKVNTLVIEDKANGSALQSVLKTKFNNIKMVNPDKDKVSRVSAIAPIVESGSLVFLRKNTIDYLEVIEEIDKFPSPSVHDDFIDALTHGLQYMSDKAGGVVSGFDWGSVLGKF